MSEVIIFVVLAGFILSSAFLTVYQGDVRLVSVDREEGTADKLVNMIPDVLKKVKGVFKKDKSESADDFSEITQDDIDG